MLPEGLVSTYLEYKRDTDAIAAWLASTAKASGFTASLTPVSLYGTNAGRLKGKARAQAKKISTASATKYIISIKDFIILAEYLLEKAVPVPRSFKSTLNRVIAARSNFSSKVDEYNETPDEESDAKHGYFVDVLKRVRRILTSLMPDNEVDNNSTPTMEEVTNRFIGLHVYEPSQEFLDAPSVERPVNAKNDPIIYEAEPASTMDDAIFALSALVVDMNRLRGIIESIWTNGKAGDMDVSAGAIATNTAIELVRHMVDDALPTMQAHGGIYNVLEKFYVLQCLGRGFKKEDLVAVEGKENMFNYDTYDVANATFFMAYRLFSVFLPAVKPGQVLLYRETWAKFDRYSDRSKKSGLEKFEDDRSLIMPFLTDLMTVALAVPKWPVKDEFLRGMKHMVQKKEVPFYTVFACQVFLDITYVMGPEIERGWATLRAHTEFMSKDIESYLDFHANLKIKSWIASNDVQIQNVRNEIEWINEDPVYKVQKRLYKAQGVDWDVSNMHRIFRSSPVLSGLVLYNFRFGYYETGTAVADAWGSIQYVEHLYNGLFFQNRLSGRWMDMDVVKNILGGDSFYAGGEDPTEPTDMLKKFCLQMGVSMTVMMQGRRKGAAKNSKSRPRGFKPNAPVYNMFADRYAGDGAMVFTAAQVQQIVDLSTFENEKDEATGKIHLGQTEDAQKLKEKKRLRHQVNNPSKHKRPAAEGARMAPDRLIQLLVYSLQAETLEFMYPYLLMHRWCWQILRDLKEGCDAELREAFGPEYIDGETQLPLIVGFIISQSIETDELSINNELLDAAAKVVNEILDTEAVNFVVSRILGERLGMNIKMVQTMEEYKNYGR